MLQQLFKKPVILDSKAHQTLKLTPSLDYKFTKEIAFAPIGLKEFWQASKSLFIVFTGNEKEVAPIVLLGDKSNQLLNEQNQWQKNFYIPQVLRTYPFGVTQLEEQKKVIVFDESCELFSQEQGIELFEEDKLSKGAQQIIDFTSYTYAQLEQSKELSQKLIEFNLLSLAQITLNTNNESKELGSFYIVNEKKLNQLNSKQFRQLATKGFLNLIYMHLNSLQNNYVVA